MLLFVALMVIFDCSDVGRLGFGVDLGFVVCL